MASNRKYENGRKLKHAVDSGTLSGAPVLVGKMTGVALTDRDTSGNAIVDHGGVYDLSVKGVDDAGNSAVAIGDQLFFTNADTPEISKKESGYFFGYALEAVNSGATATIMVKQIDAAGPGSSDIVNLTIATADIADDAVTFAQAQVFVSAETTGTGSAQNVAHGLGVAPAAVLVVPTEHPGTPDTGAFDVAEGTHTTTNVVLTVTANVKFKVLAWA
jgi:predicted RecA/RadA family phage recombinase